MGRTAGDVGPLFTAQVLFMHEPAEVAQARAWVDTINEVEQRGRRGGEREIKFADLAREIFSRGLADLAPELRKRCGGAPSAELVEYWVDNVPKREQRPGSGRGGSE